MTKYKLLKDLPEIPADTVVIQSDTGEFSFEDKPVKWYTDLDRMLTNLVGNKAWFQPLPDESKRWRAKHGEVFYFVNYDNAVESDRDTGWARDMALYEAGNYFPTEQSAQAAAEAIRAVLEVLHTSIDADHHASEKARQHIIKARQTVQQALKERT